MSSTLAPQQAEQDLAQRPEAAGPAAAAGAPLHDIAAPPPAHPTARGRRQATIARRQQVIGNAAAQRVLARRAAQRDGAGLPEVPQLRLSEPGLTMPRPRRPGLAEGLELRLDPEIEAQLRMRTIGQVQAALDPAAVRGALARVAQSGPLPAVTPPATGTPAAAPGATTPPAQQARPDEAQPRAATLGDLLQVPLVAQTVDQLQTVVGERVGRDWDRLRLDEQALTLSVAVTIAGSALGMAVARPDEMRDTPLGLLSGQVIPVPGVAGLSAEIDFGGGQGNLTFGLHFDLGRYLPASLGFGPGSAEALGDPPAQRMVAPGAAATIQRQEPVDPPAAASAEAQRLWSQAQRLFGRGNYRGAIVRFERLRQLGELSPEDEAQLLYNIGIANLHLERYATAIIYFEQYLTMPGADATEGAARLEEARRRAGADRGPEPGGADPSGAAPTRASAEAQRLWSQAQRLFARGNYRGAIVRFERLRQLGELSPEDEAQLLYNIGIANLRLERYATAIIYFEQYLTMSGADATEGAARLEEARRGIAERRSGPGGAADAGAAAPSPEARRLWEEGQRAYEEGDYRRAIACFEQLLARGELPPADEVVIREDIARARQRLGDAPLDTATEEAAGAGAADEPAAASEPAAGMAPATMPGRQAGRGGAESSWEQGNPAGRVEQIGERRLVLWNFGVADAALKPEHIAALEQLLQRNGLVFLARGPRLVIDGHASSSGDAINPGLSAARAESVARWVLAQGRLRSDQLERHAYGESRLRVAESGPEQMAMNRRVEVEIRVPSARVGVTEEANDPAVLAQIPSWVPPAMRQQIIQHDLPVGGDQIGVQRFTTADGRIGVIWVRRSVGREEMQLWRTHPDDLAYYEELTSRDPLADARLLQRTALEMNDFMLQRVEQDHMSVEAAQQAYREAGDFRLRRMLISLVGTGGPSINIPIPSSD